MSVHARRRAPLALLLGLLVCAPMLAVQSGVTAANAAPPAPNVHQPTPGTGVPTITWDRVDVPGDVKYEAKLFNQAHTQLETSSTTVNNSWTPTIQVPTGVPLTVEVQTIVGAERSPAAAVSVEREPSAAPVPVQPADGASFAEPGTPLVYRWDPVAGADSYTVEVGPTQDLDSIDPTLVTRTETPGTSYAPNVIPTPGTHWWRVIANMNANNTIRSDASVARSYTVTTAIRSGGDSSVPLSPVYPAHGAEVTITDVALQWHPIDGAATYTLQYGTEPGFTNAVTVTNIKSTRYSPTETLDNNQYYWRVAPVFANGVNLTTVWDQMPVWQFQRKWADQPRLVYPADDGTIADPVYYEWTPVRWASRYRLQVSPNRSFTPLNTLMQCDTKGTTYAPFKRPSLAECWPTAAGTFYWRVIAYDDPSEITSEVPNAPVHRFTYRPARVTPVSPAHGADVQVPTLSWELFPLAAKYRVTITPLAGGTPIVKETVATSFTPLSRLTVGSSYRWDVTPVYGDGRLGSPLVAESQRTFRVVAETPAEDGPPIPTGPTGEAASGFRPAGLTWTPVPGALSYRVLVRRAGTTEGFTVLDDVFVYPSGSDSAGQRLEPDTYEWYVQAQTATGLVVTPSNSRGTYTVLPLEDPTGEVLALTGSDAVDQPAGGNLYCQPVATQCSNLRQTPVFTWDPVPGAAQYRLYVSHDASNTNPAAGYPTLVKNTVFSPKETLPDSEAGTAYFYRVVPCWTGGEDPLCTAFADLDNRFSKVSHQVQPVTPDGDVQQNDIVLRWDDYHCTLQGLESCTSTQAELGVGPGDTGAAGVPATTVLRHAAVGVKQYRVQVSRSAENMGGTQESLRVVDQTTFTDTLKTYPEGPLYWRVQAIDGSGRDLPWSRTRRVDKQSERPVPNLGHDGGQLGSEVTLGWTPTPFAKTYDVEIFASRNTNVAPVRKQYGLQQNRWAPPYSLTPGTYHWRVRRVDVDGGPGAWSPINEVETASFVTTGAGPGLDGPADGAAVPQRAAVFSWHRPDSGPQPNRYRLSVRQGSGPWTSITTFGTSFAWKTSMTPGQWFWKVESLAGDSTVIGESPTRGFTAERLARPVEIDGPGTVGSQLELALGAWNALGATPAYQWLRNGSVITGATSPTYSVTSIDVNRRISLRVTGRHPEYDQVILLSNEVVAGAQLAVVSTVAPQVNGTKALGHTLTASPGSWKLSNGLALPSQPTFTYQWLRNGVVIARGSGATRVVSADDVGQSLSVRVTAQAGPEYQPGTASSPNYRVARVTSRTSMRLSSSVVRFGAKPRATIVVTAAVTPRGTVKVYDGGKVIKTTRLTAANRGRLVLTLPARPRGLRYLKAKYVGNTQIGGSLSPKVRLRVR